MQFFLVLRGVEVEVNDGCDPYAAILQPHASGAHLPHSTLSNLRTGGQVCLTQTALGALTL